jgi:GlcNAc-PI de-N-acetylase
MSVRVDEVDLGWDVILQRDPRVVMLPASYPHFEFPPKKLICTKPALGKWGTLVRGKEYRRYEKRVISLVSKHVADNTIIILPEFASHPRLETRLRAKLNRKRKRCIVIGGTYYRRESEIVESVCPIITGQRPIVYQKKFEPSGRERDFGMHAVPHRDREIKVFTNSGFGRFAVIVCSDALPARAGEVLGKLRNQIDFLVVIARNQSKRLTGGLTELAKNESWFIIYCNSMHATSRSRLLFPDKRRDRFPRTRNGTRVPISEFIAAPKPDTIKQPRTTYPETKSGPRSQPYRDGVPLKHRAITFSNNLVVLAIASHFDDVWIGCLGTLMLLNECFQAKIHVACICSNYPELYYGKIDLRRHGRTWRGLTDRIEVLTKALHFQSFDFLDSDAAMRISDRSFDRFDGELNQAMNDLANKHCDPDLVFIPRRDDEISEDHVRTAKAALRVFKKADVLEYEIKDFRRSPFRPSLFVDLSGPSSDSLTLGRRQIFSKGGPFAHKKAVILDQAFRVLSGNKLPRDFDISRDFQKDHVLARMRMRAAEVIKDVEFAEAFVTEVLV